MSKIHMLSEVVWNKIAAGEVVERPASIVKELLENSLDAGATKVVVAIEKAGEKLIRVIDNGEGMDPDDALLCFESHATSKIRAAEDIFQIHSFGFRGEAMPSIASVAKVYLKSRQRDTNEGVEVVIHGGKMIASNPVGCPPGTEVAVRDLFFNTPARRKFLKTIATEERHIIETVTNISLAHADVAFELICDGRNVLGSPAASNLLPRIRELFGREYGDALVPVSSENYGVSVKGFISTRSYTKASRQDQRVFVNGRPIESSAIYRGIKDGFGPMLERGRYPVALLFIALDPMLVDVNVHPAKREVRFHREFEMIAAVRTAVSTALRAADPVIPFTPGAERGPERSSPDFHSVRSFYPDYPAASSPDAVAPEVEALGSMEAIIRASRVDYQVRAGEASIQQDLPAAVRPLSSLLPQKDSMDSGASDPQNANELPLGLPAAGQSPEETSPFRLEREEARPTPLGTQGMKLLGVLENSYIIGTISGGLILIDQHAAHERVLFEKILKGVDSSLSQKLLIPISIELSRADMGFVSRNLNEFEKVGFELDVFGQNTVKLNAIPAAIPQENAGGIFQDMISRLTDSPLPSSKLERDMIARAACKAAVKSHDHLSPEECESLLKQMAQCEMPFSCPHGRPTILNISIAEIERRFGRKG